jgi:putative transposase
MRYRRIRVDGGTYFFTVVTDRRRPIFGSQETVALLDVAINRIKVRWPFELDAIVILPDHLHAIWTMPEGESNYSTRWRLIKESFTRSWLAKNGPIGRSPSRAAKGEQSVWQRRFWEHTIRDEDDFIKHLDYIHANPVQHGLTAAPADWPYSSFRDWVARGAYTPDWMPIGQLVPDWASKYEQCIGWVEPKARPNSGNGL